LKWQYDMDLQLKNEKGKQLTQETVLLALSAGSA
jgi:hypothetical protein